MGLRGKLSGESAVRSSIDMLVAISLSILAHLTTGAPSPTADAHGIRYGHGFGHGYHGHGRGYIVSPCTHTLEEVEKEICHLEPEKKCETKTHTYKVITGYEKGECKAIEVCKHPPHHKREASPYGYGYIKCEKEKKAKDHELCRLEPKKVCEMKTVKVPKLVCEEA